jgi:hypothetical protein
MEDGLHLLKSLLQFIVYITKQKVEHNFKSECWGALALHACLVWESLLGIIMKFVCANDQKLCIARGINNKTKLWPLIFNKYFSFVYYYDFEVTTQL